MKVSFFSEGETYPTHQACWKSLRLKTVSVFFFLYMEAFFDHFLFLKRRRKGKISDWGIKDLLVAKIKKGEIED
jgi:hypothetical protein